MAREFEAPDEVGGGNFLSEPGTYHFSINAMNDEVDRVECELAVLAGTVPDQENKTTRISFFDGKLTHKDEGRFARQRQAALFLAANLMSPDDLGKGISINVEQAAGSQIVMTVKKTQDGKYLDADGLNVYHVDDPRAKAFPKHKEALALIDKSQRHDEAYFAPLLKKTSKPEGQKAKAGLTDDQLADL